MSQHLNFDIDYQDIDNIYANILENKYTIEGEKLKYNRFFKKNGEKCLVCAFYCLHFDNKRLGVRFALTSNMVLALIYLSKVVPLYFTKRSKILLQAATKPQLALIPLIQISQ